MAGLRCRKLSVQASGARPGRLRLLTLALTTSMLLAACGTTSVKAKNSTAFNLTALLRLAPSPTQAVLVPGVPPLLDALKFLNPQAGWVGGSGVILATRDGGADWHRQYTGPGNVTGFSFFSEDVGYAATDLGLLATVNGRTWRKVSAQPLEAVQFVTPSLGWALGIHGTGTSSFRLMSTSDGGRVWQSLGAGPVQGFCRISPSQGFVAMWAGPGLDIRRTQDAGRSWATVLTVPQAYPAQLSCTRGGAWLVATCGADTSQQFYSVYRSVAAGEKWIPVLGQCTTARGSATAAVFPTPGPIAAIGQNHATMLGICWPCGYGGTVTLDRTADGGRVWHQQARPLSGVSPSSPLVLEMPARDLLFLLSSPVSRPSPGAGGQSLVQVSTDGGATWHTVLHTGPGSPMIAVRFVSRGWVMGLAPPGIPCRSCERRMAADAGRRSGGCRPGRSATGPTTIWPSLAGKSCSTRRREDSSSLRTVARGGADCASEGIATGSPGSTSPGLRRAAPPSRVRPASSTTQRSTGVVRGRCRPMRGWRRLSAP